MERLTNCKEITKDTDMTQQPGYSVIYKRLAEYEEAEEQAKQEPTETMNFAQGLECVRLVACLEGMKAANTEREANGEALAYGENGFFELAKQIADLQKQWIDGMKLHYERMRKSSRRRM